eukprot:TRINITY_DN21884_c0_g1_i2.p1 TRINITY_DN21884_c0_g1~~TRINITY_DN21884_c0_g1_i2.p1  ORF type:complete len:114 (-),score=13.90 TRINITY_DN21884_c0_g1_i2:30-371(-)
MEYKKIATTWTPKKYSHLKSIYSQTIHNYDIPVVDINGIVEELAPIDEGVAFKLTSSENTFYYLEYAHLNHRNHYRILQDSIRDKKPIIVRYQKGQTKKEGMVDLVVNIKKQK